MKGMKFEPMQWVLARDLDKEWVLCQFSHFSEVNSVYPYVMCGGGVFSECIPYEGNEHLRGTTDDYVEPYVPHDGDFVTATDTQNATIFIYSEKDSGCKSYGSYTGLFNGREGLCLSRSDAWCAKVRTIRPSTEEEKNLLLFKLHGNGKNWDAEKKEVVDWKWEPSEGECFYHPIFRNGEFVSISGVWDNEVFILKDCVFQTDEECTYVCNLLNEFHKREINKYGGQQSSIF